MWGKYRPKFLWFKPTLMLSRKAALELPHIRGFYISHPPAVCGINQKREVKNFYKCLVGLDPQKKTAAKMGGYTGLRQGGQQAAGIIVPKPGVGIPSLHLSHCLLAEDLLKPTWQLLK